MPASQRQQQIPQEVQYPCSDETVLKEKSGRWINIAVQVDIQNEDW